MSTTVADLHGLMRCYGSSLFLRGLWSGITGQIAPASRAHQPEEKEAMRLLQMLRKERSSGQMHDLAHVRSDVSSCPRHRIQDRSRTRTYSPSSRNTSLSARGFKATGASREQGGDYKSMTTKKDPSDGAPQPHARQEEAYHKCRTHVQYSWYR